MLNESPGEDRQRAVSGMETHIECEVGTWDLAVRFVHESCSWVVIYGALHFRGDAQGNLTLAIETPEERMNGV